MTAPRPVINVRLPSRGSENQPADPTAGEQAREHQTPTTPKDPELVAVFLPSGFHPYPFKELYLRKVRGKHQARFAQAANLDNVKLVTDTVTSLIGGDVDALDLTPNDFQYVMYWLRLNCYGKIPFTVKSVCSKVDHVDKVTRGELPPESLVTVDIVDRTTLKEVLFDTSVLDGFDASLLDDTPWELGHPRQRDVNELIEWVERDDFRELEYLSDFASCIQHRERRATLMERIQFLMDAEPELLVLLGKYHALISSYGVEETIKTRCKECGAEIVTEVPFSASTFSG